MSENLVLIFDDTGITLGGIAEVLGRGATVALHPPVLMVSTGRDACHLIDVSDEDRAEAGTFEGWPPEDVPTWPVAVFSMDYKSTELAVAIVRRLAGWRPLLVDTNFDRVVAGRDLEPGMLVMPG
ncbi:hypothetical protein ACQPZF_19810 [Actinosynnema sp. CS-041913]|uniref:hypothetical protein n=1 Tax=Actinosynnema sp. CS-041913 TaxID=3239917 RepID=UPI003D91B8C1